ncbi:MAG: DNA-3-methyladenine glycosylase family protein [Pyrinomonadaceae bacterium]
MSKPLDRQTLARACRELAAADPTLGVSLARHGTPPLWDREPGFATLLQIILEQQVSLASAKACFDKLAARLGGVRPEGVLTLDDDEMRAVGFSRQKAAYARHLAEAVLDGRFDFEAVHSLPDHEAKHELMRLKGVGHWTADIYLLMAMLRPDVMPRGDLALHIAWQKITGAERRPDADEFLTIAESWRPYRSVAARMLWHFYLSDK